MQRIQSNPVGKCNDCSSQTPAPQKRKSSRYPIIDPQLNTNKLLMRARNSPNEKLEIPSLFQSMGEKEKDEKKKDKMKSASDAHFKPSSNVKGIRFGGQFVVRSFTVRHAAPLELTSLLDIPISIQSNTNTFPFPSTTAYLPTNFTILAHHAWHTLTLGLGTKNSKILIFVFESDSMKAAVDRLWPGMIPLGDVNRKLIRGLAGCEMARFKFRKGCLTFYVYAVRPAGAAGFTRADDLRRVLESIVGLKDFLDHTAMLAMPTQRSIAACSAPATMAYRSIHI